MATYHLYSIVLVLLLIVTSLWFFLSAEKGERPFRANKRHTFVIWGVAAVLGAATYLCQNTMSLNGFGLGLLGVVSFLIMGLFHIRFLNKRGAYNPKQTWAYLLFLSTASSVFCFVVGWGLEQPFFGSAAGMADNLASTCIFGLLPFAILQAHQYWNRIPILRQELIAWPFPDTVPGLLENGPCAISFKVEPGGGQTKQQTIPIRVLPTYTLAQVFHRAVYEYNIVRRSPYPVEIAKDNKKSNLYAWHFHLPIRSNMPKQYLDPEATLEHLGLRKGGTVYVHRAKQ